MAKTSADRRIVYNLLAKYDAQSDKAFDLAAKKFQSLRDLSTIDLTAKSASGFSSPKSNGAASADASAAFDREATKAKAASEKTAAASIKAAEKKAAAEATAAEKAAADAEKAAAKKAAAEARASKAAETAREREAAAAEKAASRKAAADEAAARRSFLAVARLNRMAEAAEAKRLAAKERDEKKAEAASERAAKAAEKAAERHAKAEDRAAAKIERDRTRSEKAAERAADKHREAVGELREQALNGVKSTLQLAKGWAEVHAASIPGLEGMVSALAKIEGAFNAVEGGIDIYRSLAGYVEKYRETVELATAAEKAAAAVRSGRTIAGAGSTPASVAASAGGSGAASVAAAGGKAAAGGGLASIAAPAAAGAAALVGLVAATVSAIDGLKQVNRYGFRAGAEIGSWTDKIATAEAGVAEWVASLAQSAGVSKGVFSRLTDALGGPLLSGIGEAAYGAAESATALDRLAKASKTAAENLEQQRAFALANYQSEADVTNQLIDALESQGQLQATLRGGDEEAEKANQFASAVEHLQDLKDQLAETRSKSDMFDSSAAGQEAAKAAKADELRIIKEIEQTTAKIYSLKKDGDKTAVESLEKQLEKAEDILRTMEQQAKTARGELQDDVQKFAEMNPSEKMAVERGKEKLEKGEALTPYEAAQLGKLDSFKDKAGRNRVENMDAQERGVFSGRKTELDDLEANVTRQSQQAAGTKKKIAERKEENEDQEHELAETLGAGGEKTANRIADIILGALDARDDRLAAKLAQKLRSRAAAQAAAVK